MVVVVVAAVVVVVVESALAPALKTDRCCKYFPYHFKGASALVDRCRSAVHELNARVLQQVSEDRGHLGGGENGREVMGVGGQKEVIRERRARSRGKISKDA